MYFVIVAGQAPPIVAVIAYVPVLVYVCEGGVVPVYVVPLPKLHVGIPAELFVILAVTDVLQVIVAGATEKLTTGAIKADPCQEKTNPVPSPDQLLILMVYVCPATPLNAGLYSPVPDPPIPKLAPVCPPKL